MSAKLTDKVWSLVADHLQASSLLAGLLIAAAVVALHCFLTARRAKEDAARHKERAAQAEASLERAETSAPRERRRGAAGDGRRSPSRVMVVEDDPYQQTLIREMLAQCLTSVEVRASTSAREALANVETFKPELMVLDLHLHGESGIQVIQRLRTRQLHVPILVYSGSDEDIEALRALRVSANLQDVVVLQKGSDHDAFKTLVPTLFRRRASDAGRQTARCEPGGRPDGGPRERRVLPNRRQANRPFADAARDRRGAGSRAAADAAARSGGASRA